MSEEVKPKRKRRGSRRISHRVPTELADQKHLAIFQAWALEKATIFVNKYNVEAIQSAGNMTYEGKLIPASMVYFVGKLEPEMVFEPAELLSLRYFGHTDAYSPVSGEAWPYYFNMTLIVYLKAVDGGSSRSGDISYLSEKTKEYPIVVVMQSGRTYAVKKQVKAAVSSLLSIMDETVRAPLGKNHGAKLTSGVPRVRKYTKKASEPRWKGKGVTAEPGSESLPELEDL